jgi:hypothetical protein
MFDEKSEMQADDVIFVVHRVIDVGELLSSLLLLFYKSY